VPFYAEVAQRALDQGCSISVITMEGEDCAMENLGSAADITRGQVEIVDPSDLSLKVQQLLSQRTVAIEAECRLLTGCTLESSSSASASKHAAFSAARNIARHVVGNVTDDLDISFKFRADGLGQTRVPFQAQLKYKLPNGEERMHVESSYRVVTPETEKTEDNMDATVVGVEAIHRSAQLAQQGLYEDARIELISTQRLLQRAMKTSAHQEAYLSFVIQAEKLDQFMREVFQKGGQVSRDDEAAKAMYQMKALSVRRFQTRT